MEEGGERDVSDEYTRGGRAKTEGLKALVHFLYEVTQPTQNPLIYFSRMWVKFRSLGGLEVYI